MLTPVFQRAFKIRTRRRTVLAAYWHPNMNTALTQMACSECPHNADVARTVIAKSIYQLQFGSKIQAAVSAHFRDVHLSAAISWHMAKAGQDARTCDCTCCMQIRSRPSEPRWRWLVSSDKGLYWREHAPLDSKSWMPCLAWLSIGNVCFSSWKH